MSTSPPGEVAEHNVFGALAKVVSTIRRGGIGRALIGTAKKDFAKRGIRRVAWDTRLALEDTHEFYESLGYERNGLRFVKQFSVSN